MSTIRDFIANGDTSVFDMLLYGAKLEDIQKELLLDCLSTPEYKGIITAEMGLGKTYIGATLTQMALALTGKKVLLVVPKNKVKDFYFFCKKVLKVRVIKSSGVKKDVDNLKKNFEKAQVVVVQQSAWIHSMDFNIFMYNKMDEFGLVFYDEAALKDSAGFMAYCEFSRYADMSFIANATPVGKDIQLTYNLLYAVGATDLSLTQFRSRYSATSFNNGKTTETINIDAIKRDFSQYLINKNRAELGVITTINTKFIKCSPSNIQREWINGSKVRTDLALYSPGTRIEGASTVATVPALDALVKTVLMSDASTNKIIYTKNTDAIITLSTILKTLGHNVFILDGKHAVTEEDKKEVEDNFNNTQGAICITNIDKGSNLGSATEFIVYGIPNDILQTVHRSIRGFKSKEINLTWIYYPQYDKDSMIRVFKTANDSLALLNRQSDVIDSLRREISNTYPGTVLREKHM